MKKESLISTELQCLTPIEELDTQFVRSPGTGELIQLNFKLIQLQAFGCCIFPLLCLSISNEINAITLVISAVTQTFRGAAHYICHSLQLHVSVGFTLVEYLL